MSEIIQRSVQAVSRTTINVGTTPVQISGGPAQPTDTPLTLQTPGGPISFYPNRRRVGITLDAALANTQAIFIGTDNTLTPAGANAIITLNAGSSWPPGQQNLAGSAVLYAVSASGTQSLNMTEWM